MLSIDASVGNRTERRSGDLTEGMESSFRGGGELLWSLDAGRPVGLEVEGRLELRSSLRRRLDGRLAGVMGEITQDADLSGRLTVTARLR